MMQLSCNKSQTNRQENHKMVDATESTRKYGNVDMGLQNALPINNINIKY